MVNSGTEHTAVTQPTGLLSKKNMTNVGDTGVPEERPIFWPKRCVTGEQEVQHKLLYLSNFLLGRDLLQKVQAQIILEPPGNMTLSLAQPGTMVLTLTITQTEE